MSIPSETALQLFGRVVRQHREKLGCTQQELAQRAGWQQSFINEVESGKRNVTFHTILRFACLLDIKPSTLFELVDTRPDLYPSHERRDNR